MNKETLWENIGFIALGLCVFGQVAIGWFFIPAQIAYLIANVINVSRTFILKRPLADKVRDITFVCITIAVLAIKIFA